MDRKLNAKLYQRLPLQQEREVLEALALGSRNLTTAKVIEANNHEITDKDIEPKTTVDMLEVATDTGLVRLKIYILLLKVYIWRIMKTTVILDDDLYKQLVQEALEKYGTTRKLSLLINEKLKGSGRKVRRGKEGLSIRIGSDLKPEEIDRLTEEGWRKVIKWKP